jgi:ribosomal protein S18 acetylase RimI-like enzyme
MGYAKMLFDELVKEAKQNNITIITLDAYSMDPTRISTEKLVEMYQKWGFNVVDEVNQLPQQNKVKMIYNV